MIQTSTFALSKDIARLPMRGAGRVIYSYLGDIRSQWEMSDVSTKALDLIGTESMPPGHLGAVQEYLGPLSAAESRFLIDGADFLNDVAKLVTTLPPTFDPSPDLYETILDTRLIAGSGGEFRTVLDIGAGAGRHMLSCALRPEFAGAAYCAVDSVGLPYMLQNLMAAELSIRNRALKVVDTTDYEFAQRTVDFPHRPPPGSIWHVPLWHSDLLPQGAFDLILCNYVLDEVPPEDFRRIVSLIGRCLAPNGLVYCRGGQQKSMLSNLYSYGLGTYHGVDITATFQEAGFVADDCQLIAGVMTRTFVRAGASRRSASTSPFATMSTDAVLVDAMQRHFIQEHADRIKQAGLRTLIWSDPDYAAAFQYLADLAGEIPVVGVTNFNIVERGIGPFFGWPTYPLDEIAALEPQAVIIAGARYKFGLRLIAERLPNLDWVLSFNFPMAVCYCEAPPTDLALADGQDYAVTLVSEHVFGYDILHVRDRVAGSRYYAIPEADGPFQYGALPAGAHPGRIEGTTLTDVLNGIRQREIYGDAAAV